MFLLDTSVISELRWPVKADRNVAAPGERDPRGELLYLRHLDSRNRTWGAADRAQGRGARCCPACLDRSSDSRSVQKPCPGGRYGRGAAVCTTSRSRPARRTRRPDRRDRIGSWLDGRHSQCRGLRTHRRRADEPVGARIGEPHGFAGGPKSSGGRSICGTSILTLFRSTTTALSSRPVTVIGKAITSTTMIICSPTQGRAPQ
jgi:hypothetical protein